MILKYEIFFFKEGTREFDIDSLIEMFLNESYTTLNNQTSIKNVNVSFL